MHWHKALKSTPEWSLRGDKVWHHLAKTQKEPERLAGVRQKFVNLVYADQNRSTAVRETLAEVLRSMPADGIALNVGAGGTRYPRVVNLEIHDGPNVDVVGHGTELPFADETVDLVITQEVLEHVPDYLLLVREVHRVLKPGGVFYCQVPFQIGFHPGPYDCWRFSRHALEHIFSAPNWRRDKVAITLGHGSGFYRIAVEFIAVTASCLMQALYKPAKGMAALFLYPIKFFDLLTPFSNEKDRIPGGYLCVARKL